MKIQLPMPELQDYLYTIYPQTQERFYIEQLEEGELVMSMKTKMEDIRPGGTISGPSLFTLVDCAFYALVLSVIGKKPLAVTSNLNINFLRKPAQEKVLCRTRILKLGKKLCVGDALVYSQKQIVVQATITYAIPSKK